MKSLTPERLQELRALCDKATPGPVEGWREFVEAKRRPKRGGDGEK